MKIDILRSFFRWYLAGKIPSQEKIKINSIKTILVMSNTAIGDTLFSTPALRLIKERYPNKKVIGLLNPKNSLLFDNNPYIDILILYSGKWRQFLRTVFELRRHNVDLALIMHSNEPQATPLAYCSGVKYIIKIPNDQNEFNFLHQNPVIGRNINEHFIDRRLKQLEYIDIITKSYRMDIFQKEEWIRSINGILKDDIVNIGFQIGASTISRMWFIEKWIDLAKLVLDHNENLNIVLTGSKVDQQTASSICSSLSDDRVLDLTGKLDLGAASSLIDRLDLLVTPDTGPLHIAAAMNTPTIAISVAGRALESNPRSIDTQHIFIQKQITCEPCIDKKCKYQKCMLQITSSEVFDKILNIIEF
jgi:ADP-heptose:LPS heptosyltransferase